MAYDAMAGFVYSLDTDLLAEKVPSEYQTFLDNLEKCEADIDGFAMSAVDGMFLDIENEEDEEALVASYFALKEAFRRETGLTIQLTYVQESEASSYNEVSGGVWEVLNAIQFTPEAQKFEGKIELQFFCIYG
jgi:hypothetical protein